VEVLSFTKGDSVIHQFYFPWSEKKNVVFFYKFPPREKTSQEKIKFQRRKVCFFALQSDAIGILIAACAFDFRLVKRLAIWLITLQLVLSIFSLKYNKKKLYFNLLSKYPKHFIYPRIHEKKIRVLCLFYVVLGFFKESMVLFCRKES
jgi:hypothetical protein